MSNYSYDSEQCLLSCLLQDFGAWEAIQPLKPEHFFINVHRVIYTAISKVVADKKAPDPVIVAAALGDQLEECGGLVYLRALEETLGSTSKAAHYAEIIRDRYKERQLLAACEDVRGIVEQNIPISEKVESAYSLFEQLSKSTVKRMPRSILEIALERTQYYEDVQMGKIVPGWPTRIPGLDCALTGGIRPAKLIILAARPGVGKSSLSWQLAMCMGSQNKATLFLSMEMPESEVADRAVSNMARVDYQSLLTGKMSEHGWSAAGEALEEMRSRAVFVDDQPALTLADVKAKARSVPDLKVLVVDYIQLMQGSGDNRNNQIEEISRGLKALAKELDICVIALSQLNREVEKRTDKRPNLSNLRDSGAIEQDADIVMFLWPVREFPDGRKIVGLGIDKNRQGRQCEIALDFDGATQRWGESDEPLRSESSPQKTYTKGMPE